MAKGTYEFNFSYDDGNWSLVDAIISSGVLNIIANQGRGIRYPDVNWYSGTDDDFILEVAFKQDSVPDEWAMNIVITLEETFPIYFEIFNTTMRIFYDGVVRASQVFNPGITWHTAKIRRVGTMYYFSIDGGDEISWGYGEAEGIYHIALRMTNCTGNYDNFKYSWIEIEEDYAFIM